MSLDDWKIEFARRIESTMQTQGIHTQRELSERSGISEVSMSRYMNGERVPKITSIIRIANALMVTPSYLVDFGETVDLRGEKL